MSGFFGSSPTSGWRASGVQLPLFVPCLLAGICSTNILPSIAPRVAWPSRTPALALIAEVSLGDIPSDVAHEHAALGARRSRRPADRGAPAFSLRSRSCSRWPWSSALLGRNYDAAVISAGFIGFGLGATPTAMANMTAVTQRHGASHVAFLVVPLVGAFFIDLLNTVVIRLFLAAL